MTLMLIDDHTAHSQSAGIDFATDAARWAAVCRRAPDADGHFLYSVATTGVYCRPSCAARTPRRENVGFHLSRTDAEQAGFRACKRCRPDLPPRAEREAALVANACRTIESAETPPSLADLAARAGLSPHHFHRMFRRIAGVTPKAYAAAGRQRAVQAGLRAGSGVTEAIYDAGFNSSGRFYEAAPKMLGMTPTAFRQGGKGEAIRYAVSDCSLGLILVAATVLGVCAIFLGDDGSELITDLRHRFPKADFVEPDTEFGDLVAKIVRLVDDPADADERRLPLDIRGTVFQRRVWEALRQIPAGTTASYTEIARRIGNPRAVRAVAGACAANPLAVAIPCHRVVAKNGDLAGYHWGAQRKRRLLERERR